MVPFHIRLIGVDVDASVLEIAKSLMAARQMTSFFVMEGDIATPGIISRDLADTFGVNMRDGVHIRSFLDHNRHIEAPDNTGTANAKQRGPVFEFQHVADHPSCAYVSRDGKSLSGDEVCRSLFAHFQRWSAETGRFGVIFIDSISFPDSVMQSTLGRHRSLGIVHAYSAQYLASFEQLDFALAASGYEVRSWKQLNNVISCWIVSTK